MINAKELRIGNRVKDADGDFEVLSIEYDVNKYWIGINKGTSVNAVAVEPIELTEDILIKFGFVEVINNFEWDLPDHSFPVTRKRGTNHFKALYQGVEIKYLHQLQNLYFALKGEELSIELSVQVSDTSKAT